MSELNEIVTMYLVYATRQAKRHIPMTMADWTEKLDAFLKFNDAESEFEKYRVIQDASYQSDFDPCTDGKIDLYPHTDRNL